MTSPSSKSLLIVLLVLLVCSTVSTSALISSAGKPYLEKVSRAFSLYEIYWIFRSNKISKSFFLFFCLNFVSTQEDRYKLLEQYII